MSGLKSEQEVLLRFETEVRYEEWFGRREVACDDGDIYDLRRRPSALVDDGKSTFCK